MRRIPFPALLVALLAAACSADESGYATASREETVSASDADGLARGRQAPGADGGAVAADTAAGAPAAEPGASPNQPGAAPAPAAQMIIRNGHAAVRVDSLETAIERVREMARRLGGYVGNTTIQTGAEQVRTATVELKIPSARFDQALAGLNPLGKVERVQVTAQDVGEEYVDVTARASNARRLEERLVSLLATRTGRLEDVLAVERELARVREEIERFEGRLRYLRTRVAVSTLVVELHEPYPLTGDYPGENRILGAFRDAWAHFVNFLVALIESLGVLVPLGLLVAAFIWITRRLWPRYGPRPPAPPAGPPPPPPGPPPAGDRSA